MNTVKFTPDDGRRVYSVPVKMVVECTLYVLAPNDEQAKTAISLVNLEDYFSFDHDSITTDGEALLKITDVFTNPIDPLVAPVTMMDTKDYPPNEHPDFVGIPLR